MQSKRANIYLLEFARVLQKEERVLYLMENGEKNDYFNIPVANTTALLLGNGTSITQPAMRLLSKAGVMVGFCGSGGTPLYGSVEIEWLSPNHEYRPTKYFQNWVNIWSNEQLRLKNAKKLQKIRLQNIVKYWSTSRYLKLKKSTLVQKISSFQKKIDEAANIQELLSIEGRMTKFLFHLLSTHHNMDFTRDHDEKEGVNGLLNHGNYLAYGYAASLLWTLGISFSFALMHGKTRKGGLVFDIADIFKDALVLPLAFEYAQLGKNHQAYRDELVERIIESGVISDTYDAVKEISLSENE
jgi:CRISPR-associated protein Cas1